MKILLIAEIYSNNIGDQAIHQGIKSYLIKHKHKVISLDLSCRSNFNKYSIVKNEKFHFIKKIKPLYLITNVLKRTINHLRLIPLWIRTFKSSDLIIVGGGSLIINNTLSFPISLFFIKVISKLTKKEYIVLGCSLSKNVTVFSKILLYSFLKSAKNIYLRDKYSLFYLKSIYKLDAILSTDLALLLHRKIKGGILKDKKNIAINIIGFSAHNNLGNKVFQKRYIEFMVKIISDLDKKNYKITLFTTGENNDYINTLIILEKLGFTVKTFNPNSVNELINFLSLFDGVVTSRLHSAILSWVSGTPFVSVSWDEKINGFLNTIDMSNNSFCINSDFNDLIKKLFSNMMDTMNDIEPYKGLLRQQIEEILNEENSNFN